MAGVGVFETPYQFGVATSSPTGVSKVNETTTSNASDGKTTATVTPTGTTAGVERLFQIVHHFQMT